MNKEAIGLVPVYIKPNSPETDRLVSAYKNTVDILKNTVSHIVVVNDGSWAENVKEATITFDNNRGKAEAVRQGLQLIERRLEGKSSYVIQTDADLDQNPSDASLILNYFIDNNISPEEPVLIIGDRYSQGQAENSPHRQGMLVLQQAFTIALGYDIRDPVSGFRGYTSEYVKKFLELSRSEQYGIEVEQILIANLIGAKVFSVPLSYSRLRDPYTLSSKSLNSIYAILEYRDQLRKKGMNRLVDFFEKIKDLVETKTENFSLDLKEIGTEKTLDFNLKEGNKYSVYVA